MHIRLWKCLNGHDAVCSRAFIRALYDDEFLDVPSPTFLLQNSYDIDHGTGNRNSSATLLMQFLYCDLQRRKQMAFWDSRLRLLVCIHVFLIFYVNKHCWGVRDFYIWLKLLFIACFRAHGRKDCSHKFIFDFLQFDVNQLATSAWSKSVVNSNFVNLLHCRLHTDIHIQYSIHGSLCQYVTVEVSDMKACAHLLQGSSFITFDLYRIESEVGLSRLNLSKLFWAWNQPGWVAWQTWKLDASHTTWHQYRHHEQCELFFVYWLTVLIPWAKWALLL